MGGLDVGRGGLGPDLHACGHIVETGPPAKILNEAEHPRLKEFLAKVL